MCAYSRCAGVVQEHGLVAGAGASVEIADEGRVIVAYEPVQMMDLANVLRELGVILVRIVVTVDLSALLVVGRVKICEAVFGQEPRFPGSHEEQRVIAADLNAVVIHGQVTDDPDEFLLVEAAVDGIFGRLVDSADGVCLQDAGKIGSVEEQAGIGELRERCFFQGGHLPINGV